MTNKYSWFGILPAKPQEITNEITKRGFSDGSACIGGVIAAEFPPLVGITIRQRLVRL